MALMIYGDNERFPLVYIKQVLTSFEEKYRSDEELKAYQGRTPGWTKGSGTIPADIPESLIIKAIEGHTVDVPLEKYVTSRSFRYLTWGPGSSIAPTLQHFDSDKSEWVDGLDENDFEKGSNLSEIQVQNHPDICGALQLLIPRDLDKNIENKYRLKVTITQHDCE